MSAGRALLTFGFVFVAGTLGYLLVVGDSRPRAVGAGVVLAVLLTALELVDNSPGRKRREPLPPLIRDRTQPAVIWPYLPRPGYPSVPVWLLGAILACSITGLLSFFALIGG